LEYSKAIVLARLPEDQLDGFMAESHEINGEVKSVSDMSRRELETLVGKRKAKLPNNSENELDSSEGQELDDAEENAEEKDHDPITKAIGGMNFLNKTVEEILNNPAEIEDKSDEYEELFNDIREFCNEILKKISSAGGR
jgi:hypothetical protein